MTADDFSKLNLYSSYKICHSSQWGFNCNDCQGDNDNNYVDTSENENNLITTVTLMIIMTLIITIDDDDDNDD